MDPVLGRILWRPVEEERCAALPQSAGRGTGERRCMLGPFVQEAGRRPTSGPSLQVKPTAGVDGWGVAKQEEDKCQRGLQVSASPPGRAELTFATGNGWLEWKLGAPGTCRRAQRTLMSGCPHPRTLGPLPICRRALEHEPLI